MDLDERDWFNRPSVQKKAQTIADLPKQLLAAWQAGQGFPLPVLRQPLQHVIVAGMGGSAVGAEIAAAYAEPFCPLPVVIWRDYGLPAWAHGPETLVIGLSFSGNTEEVLSALDEAANRGCTLLGISAGGQVQSRMAQFHAAWWRMDHESMAAFAALLLAAWSRLQLLPDCSAEIHEAVQVLEAQQQSFLPETPVTRNPAKRMAGQLMGRWGVIFASDLLAPVARHWKGQINGMAGAPAQFEVLPDADHAALAGLYHPDGLLEQIMALFLQAPANSPHNTLRLEATRQVYMTSGVNTDALTARGKSRLAQQFSLLHYGDYVGLYLAMAYQEETAPEDTLAMFKDALKQEYELRKRNE